MQVRITLLLSIALGALLLVSGGVSAQAAGTNLGTPRSQPQPGGGLAVGHAAPPSASPNTAPTTDASAMHDRGSPRAGEGAAMKGAYVYSNLTPGGAIRPGTSTPGGTGGSTG